MNAEFIAALKEVEKEKGIGADIIIQAVETSLETACKDNYGNNVSVTVTIDRETGDMSTFLNKTVVDEVENENTEISLEEAVEINPDYQLEDVVSVEIYPENFGRIAATKAKQVVVQKIREAEREILKDEFLEKEKELISGIVQRETKGNIIINVGKVDAILKQREQVPGERYRVNDRIKVFVTKVVDATSGPKVYVSRTHPDLVRRLFEQEVPEVFDGVVEIKSISREAGSRTKIAVHSNNPDVDPIGACVGQNGARVNIIGDNLQGEKIDIIPWSENSAEFISAALSPSKVVKVQVDEEDKSAKVVVPDYQLSLAIGKDGQNARLAARLTGYRIDIRNETKAKETNFIEESGISENPFEEFLSHADFDFEEVDADVLEEATVDSMSESDEQDIVNALEELLEEMDDSTEDAVFEEVVAENLEEELEAEKTDEEK